jgi:hypothetical protein
MSSISNILSNRLLTSLNTVDGSDSLLDADLLDGQDSTYYLAWNVFDLVFTATEGQTTFNLSYNLNNAINFFVFLNGVKQRNGASYSFTHSGNNLIFTEPLLNGDLIEVNIMENNSNG